VDWQAFRKPKENPLKIDIEVNDGTATVIVGEPRLDAAASVEFRNQVLGVVPDPATRVLIDMSCVEFIDSSGLGALVALVKAVGGRGEMNLCGVKESVMTIFELSRMDRIFDFKPSIDAC